MLQEKMEFGQPGSNKKARLFPAGLIWDRSLIFINP